MMEPRMEPNVLKDLVLNVREPVVLRNLNIPWKCFDQPFAEWLEQLDKSNEQQEDGRFQFDCGPLRNGRQPQWERSRGKVPLTMKEFQEKACSTSGHFQTQWASYSYRYIGELPEECRREITFERFGFPNVGQDVSFWIGSKGAHTPCHYDTYGCNIVVQVHGRKSWLMFPPGAKLRPTRVPYEESSVYCEENFYSLDVYSKVEGVDNEAYHVILEPGMVLIVPPKWWHYVENLELSLNFNTWIQLESDTEEQISECLVKLIIQDYCKLLKLDTLRHIINPNELSTIDSPSPAELQATLEYLLNQQSTNKRQRTSCSSYPNNYLSQQELNKLLDAYKEFVSPVRKLESFEFYHLMKQNGIRYDPTLNHAGDDDEDNHRATNVLNRSCNPEVIKLLKTALLK